MERMSKGVPPCPQCAGGLVERQAGLWCPRCRGWVRESERFDGSRRAVLWTWTSRAH